MKVIDSYMYKPLEAVKVRTADMVFPDLMLQTEEDPKVQMFDFGNSDQFGPVGFSTPPSADEAVRFNSVTRFMKDQHASKPKKLGAMGTFCTRFISGFGNTTYVDGRI
ncbi:OLC1v1012127C1 [Oldenlandia corymbosa var. corymbosa]|uniref:OLC1v1012127C1 n=1 Tax=Oldenlandia corymbosa var. corymbosa TaxID=529605 RepID=A0AAV1DY98_OLDCO|nr:OLC1v1012127C1 [Oldenlandia corymbosa var. corymbosa]